MERKYHIVFAPTYRRQVFYGERKRAVGEVLRKLCKWKDVKILEAECCPDHIHMLLEIPPKMSVSSFMGYLKGKSSLMLYEQFGDLKFQYHTGSFGVGGTTLIRWARTKRRFRSILTTSWNRINLEISYPFRTQEAHLRTASGKKADTDQICALGRCWL